MKTKEKLCRDIDMHAQAKRKESLTEVMSTIEKNLEAALGEPTASLLDAATPDTWPAISRLLELEVGAATLRLSEAISGYEPSEEEQARMFGSLARHGRNIVEKKGREEAGQAITRMKDRFSSVFGHESDSMPRIWGEEHDVRAITRDARSSSLKLLAVLAVVRLDEDIQKNDKVESSLMALVGDAPGNALQRTTSRTISAGNNTSAGEGKSTGLHALAVSTWPGVPSNTTLISPVQCKSIWRQFQAETEYIVSQALAAQEAAKRGKSRLPPAWAMCAMVVLGFNEFMTLVQNPVYTAVLFVLYLVGKAVWVKLDITGEFEHGFVPGMTSVSTKLLPTVMNILKKLADEGSPSRSASSSTNSIHNNGATIHREMENSAAGDAVSNMRIGDGAAARDKLRQRQQVQVTHF